MTVSSEVLTVDGNPAVVVPRGRLTLAYTYPDGTLALAHVDVDLDELADTEGHEAAGELAARMLDQILHGREETR